MFRIQIFHPESNLYLNTNHESPDIEELKALLEEEAFAGPRFQIVDADDVVCYGPITRARKGPLTHDALARSLGVPMIDDPDDIAFL